MAPFGAAQSKGSDLGLVEKPHWQTGRMHLTCFSFVDHQAKEAGRHRVKRVRKRVDQSKKKLKEAGEGTLKRLYRTVRDYGPVGLGVYLTIGTVDWAIFYLLIRW